MLNFNTKMYYLKFILLISFVFQSIVSNTSTSSEQNKALAEFRLAVADKLYLPYMHTDPFLLRWLEDRQYDVNAAKEKLLKAIIWRQENDIDKILTEKVPFVDQLTNYTISASDNLGNPVVTVDFNSWDIRRIALAGKLDQLNRQMIKLMESAITKSAEIQLQKPEANQWTLLGNFQGCTLRQHGCLPCIPFYVNYITTYENYFTGSTRYIITINVPRILDPIANLVRGLMSPGTKRAFKIYSSNKAEWDFLNTIIPRDQLLRRHGGTLKH